MYPSNERLLEIATQIKAQRPPDLPELTDDEVMEMAQWVLDSEDMSEEDIKLALMDGLPEHDIIPELDLENVEVRHED